ncbi:MAG TPA: VWA domain-containing protein [Pyrinomonadaceae bacterium]|nr:VWA domain-containing protein [Pyrinomonadaceae bacterium]
MKALVHALLLTTLVCIAGASAFAQQRQPQPTPTPLPAGERPEVVTARIVRLPVTVLDKKRQPITGLTMSDFVVYEDKQPQKLEGFFDEKSELPIYVTVLMDTSYSTAGKLRFEQEAAKDFIYTVARVHKDKVAFGTFDDEVRLLQDFTDHLDLLDRAVDSIKKPGEKTSLYDAIWLTCDEKMRNVQGKRVIVIITDGVDTNSRALLRDAIDIAQRTETVIFAISTKAGFAGVVPGVGAGQVKNEEDKDLDRLCAETGGQAFFTGDMLALERSFTQVARELRSQYLLTYKPTRPFDGSRRAIEVKLADSSRKGLEILTRKSYTATDDSVKQK